MITKFFEAQHTLRRLRASAAGAYIDSFAVALDRAGYTPLTIRGYLRAAAHLGRWADSKRIAVARFDDATLKRFVTTHLPACRCIKANLGRFADAEAGAYHFLNHLRGLAVVSPKPPVPAPPKHPLIRMFRSWMTAHRGVTSSTLDAYELPIRALLTRLGSAPSRYTVAGLRGFILGMDKAPPGRVQMTVCASRAFLRCLIATNQCRAGLDAAIPTIARWRQSALPRYLSPGAVVRVLSSCPTTSVTGLRDRAILLLLVRLGLRAGDVARLRFDDIDWKAARIHIRGKERRDALLPLPQDVGDAILAYLERGRPKHRAAQIFLRVRAPHRPFHAHHAVTNIAKAALLRAGVDAPSHGAHVFRHTAATTMLRDGVELDTIRTVLRHRDFDTTLLYAKVDVATLSGVAQPWPVAQ